MPFTTREIESPDPVTRVAAADAALREPGQDDIGEKMVLNMGPSNPATHSMSSDSVKYYDRVPSINRFGGEATLLGVARISRWVLINLELDTIVPFNGLDKTVLEIEGSVALKLTTYLSINYVVRFILDRLISDEDQLQQDILLRFSLEVL